MVLVDTVYQRVLALANKEQRGYITPQDFNLFANQAQMEIFEQYFYDTNIARKSQGNDTVYADADDMLEEKLQVFENTDGVAVISNYASLGGGKVLPNTVYRIHEVKVSNKACEILNTKDFNACTSGNEMLAPTESRPVANIRNNIVRCANNTSAGMPNLVTPTEIVYFKKPSRVNWTYVVMNRQAMYDANASTKDFELHPSEETQLVNKILKLAGISNKQLDIMRAGNVMDQATTQQQPKI